MLKRLTGMVVGVTGLCAMFAGCTSIGPTNLTRDRFDYTAEVSESWKTQMLLNLVKIRYGDPPVFLDVGQIVAGYSFQRNFAATAGASYFSSGPHPNTPAGAVALTGGAYLIDSPTVTYSPMQGERFARSLMTPIPPSVILNLIQAGNPVEEVFRTSVQSINDIDNRRVGRVFVRRASPEFYALLPSLARIQTAGDIGMRVEQVGQGTSVRMIIRPGLAAAEEKALNNVSKILGLDPSLRDFPVVYGNVERNSKEIALLTRSIYEILTDMASYIDVPEAHVAERRVRPTAEPDIGPDGPLPPLIRITSSTERPADAFVAVPYNGYWFSIDSRDLPSKQTFTSIMFLFTFVETGTKEAAPILTIPTTR